MVVVVFFFCCDRCLKEEVGMAKVGCGLWLGPMFGLLVVVRFGGWVRCFGHGWVVAEMAEMGCWSSKITNVWVWRGHGEIGVGHGDGFGGNWRGSPHGWLVLLGSAFPMGFFFFF